MGGIVIPFPPHQGPVTLTFNLHNRHTYSEEQTKANRAYHRYTATIGVLALDNTLLSRFYVQSEFRTPGDLVDRILGGSWSGRSESRRADRHRTDHRRGYRGRRQGRCEHSG